ncbi:MAG: SBBP repeat-containing protein [Candidatus Hydrogenedentes bacterium]|nr:SBBP repeat-containing protein [Candidatus Hydrogenedentota bacterium]
MRNTSLQKIELLRAPTIMRVAVVLALLFGLESVGIAQAQDVELEYAVSFGIDGGTAYGEDIAVDGEGNVYTTGYFSGTVDFDPSSGTTMITSEGDYDAYVCKLDATGSLVWAKTIGGLYEERSNGIAIDVSGNVYVTGRFERTERIDDPDPVDLEEELKRRDESKSYFPLVGWDLFVSKLDSDGNILWTDVMQPTYSNDAEGFSIAVDASGNVYTTGYFEATIDFNPAENAEHIVHAWYNDIFVCKLDTSGNFVWVRTVTGGDKGFGYDLAVDDAGNVYTTGAFGGEVDLDPGDGEAMFTSVGEDDIFVQKLDSDGNFVWGRTMGGADDDAANGIAVDGSGNVYTTGSFRAVVDFDPGVGSTNLTGVGRNDVFVHKLNGDGEFVWVRSPGGLENEFFYGEGRGIVVDATGGVYTVGYFDGAMDFDPGAGESILDASGGVFVQRLSTDGNFVWARATGSNYVNPNVA